MFLKHAQTFFKTLERCISQAFPSLRSNVKTEKKIKFFPLCNIFLHVSLSFSMNATMYKRIVSYVAIHKWSPRRLKMDFHNAVEKKIHHSVLNQITVLRKFPRNNEAF